MSNKQKIYRRMMDPLLLSAGRQNLRVTIMKSNVTPKNAMRRRILEAARTRGGATGNLWCAWSEKSRASLVLPSDIALIYWLAHLEIDPDVESFRLGTAVDNFDFSINRRSTGPSKVIISDRRTREAVTQGVICVPHSEVLAKSALAVKLMKPIAFAAAIAHKECLAAANAVRALTSAQKKGVLNDVLDGLPNFDPSEVCGVFMRQTIKGFLEVDLADGPFGHRTPWMCRSLPESAY
ncbi:hypothetical protein ABDX87_27815 [Pseudomonas abietaniphila]|uniref:hypothetical protein n=1 Tax=Pseudomonas abietaniphila TaxID=89065 RepID=UPI0032175E9D